MLNYSEPPLSLEDAAERWNHREDTDYFSQPRQIALFSEVHPPYGAGVLAALMRLAEEK